jgi:hypothetical protein
MDQSGLTPIARKNSKVDIDPVIRERAARAGIPTLNPL